ncbi:hypothetical protein GCM10022294_11710 [Dietzia aurantiaca]
MPKSKGRKTKNTRSRNRVDPRASTTSTVAPSQALYLPLPYPAWQMSEVVATIQKVVPSLTEEVLLEMLLSHPLHLRDVDGAAHSITPLDLVGDDQASASDVLASLKVLHELGMLTWDATSRTHQFAEPGHS